MTITEHLLQLEERLLDPEVRKAPWEVAALLTEDFREFGSSGRVYDKAGIIRSLRQESGSDSGPASDLRRSLKEFRVLSLTPEVALATYLAEQIDAEGLVVTSLRSSIWVWENNLWQMVFHQGTPCRDILAAIASS